jgi:hypothetical protein
MGERWSVFFSVGGGFRSPRWANRKNGLALGVKARNRAEISGDEVACSCSNSKSNLGRNRATRGAVQSKGGAEKMGMYPNIPYQPVPGLVALFARVAPFTSQNPRAPHSHPCASGGFSYAAITASPMDNRRFTRDNRGGSTSSRGLIVHNRQWPGFILLSWWFLDCKPGVPSGLHKPWIILWVRWWPLG